MEQLEINSDVAARLMKHARPGESLGSVVTRLIEHKFSSLVCEGVLHPEQGGYEQKKEEPEDGKA